MGGRAKRDVQVCGPGAYVVLKSLAFRARGEKKDAYDLYYLVRNFGISVADVATRLRPLLDDQDAEKAIAYLRDDFLDPASIGPRGVAEFITGGLDEEIHANVVGFVSELLSSL